VTTATPTPFTPNPFAPDGRDPWTVIGFGGVELRRLALTKINGISTKHKWTEQKSKEQSGSTNVFGGTTLSHPKLTFTGTEAADFDELRALWERMKPIPGQGGTGTTGKATPQLSIGSPAGPSGGSSSGGSGSSSTFTTPAPGTKPEKDASSSSTPNPGPRPPTISVQYPGLLWHGITACALEEWEGPYLNDDGALESTLTIIPDQPPSPAGAGAMAPAKPGDKYAIGGGGAGGAGGGGDQVQKGAAGGAGGV